MLLTQYPKDCNQELMEAYNTIPYNQFYQNIVSLTGSFGEILSHRSRYINGEKMSKEEIKVAKSCLTNEQTDYMIWKNETKEDNSLKKTSNMLINNILK